LWELLDVWGIPFRMTLGELVARYGSRPSDWSDGCDVCRVAARSPLDPFLATSWEAQFTEAFPRGRPPGYWTGFIRRSDRVDVNHEIATRTLTPILGEPIDSSSSNTRAWTWAFGLATVQTCVFPPELNGRFGPNRRHELVPGSATECSITIRPHWREPITPEELRDYHTSEVIWQGEFGSALGWLTDGVPRQLPAGTEGDAPAWALRFDAASMQLFVRCVPDICWICPSRRLVSLRYDHMLPAKGPGEVTLDAQLIVEDKSESSYRRMQLISAPEAEHEAVLIAARKLADRLRLPLETHQEYDC
jgi:hypothetical protein